MFQKLMGHQCASSTGGGKEKRLERQAGPRHTWRLSEGLGHQGVSKSPLSSDGNRANALLKLARGASYHGGWCGWAPSSLPGLIRIAHFMGELSAGNLCCQTYCHRTLMPHFPLLCGLLCCSSLQLETLQEPKGGVVHLHLPGKAFEAQYKPPPCSGKREPVGHPASGESVLLNALGHFPPPAKGRREMKREAVRDI